MRASYALHEDETCAHNRAPMRAMLSASNSAYGINKRNRRESKDDAKPLRNSEKQSLQEGKNKNPRIFATFFRLATPFLTRKAKICHRTPDYLRFCAFILTQGTRDGC